MKGERTLKILEAITENTMRSLDLIGVLFASGYRAPYGKLRHRLHKKDLGHARRGWEKEARQRYYNLLYKLERDGLVLKDQNKIFGITERGRLFLKRLKQRRQHETPAIHYSVVSNNRFVIVAFDIPESERKKRNWLREVLKHIGLKMIQKSLWMGKIKLPKEFIDDLYRQKLTECVEIFEITKTGSLKHVF